MPVNRVEARGHDAGSNRPSRERADAARAVGRIGADPAGGAEARAGQVIGAGERSADLNAAHRQSGEVSARVALDDELGDLAGDGPAER